jgi:hypothetical protein
MTLYADTSFVVATRVPHDTFHREAAKFYESYQRETWLWFPCGPNYPTQDFVTGPEASRRPALILIENR